MFYRSINKKLQNMGDKIADLNIDGDLEIGLLEVDLATFDSVVSKIKELVLIEGSEHRYFHDNFYVDNFYDNMSVLLDKMMNKFFGYINMSGISFKEERYLKDSLSEIANIIDILIFDYNYIKNTNKKSFFKKDLNKLNKIKRTLENLNSTKKSLEEKVNFGAKIIANEMMMNYEEILLFFNYALKVAKLKNDELLLIELSCYLDKIVDMLSPVIGNDGLKSENIAYSYMIFELKELKKIALGKSFV